MRPIRTLLAAAALAAAVPGTAHAGPRLDDVDPIVCPIFASVAGPLGVNTPFGYIAVSDIDSDGDVYLLGDPNARWDCPPYGA